MDDDTLTAEKLNRAVITASRRMGKSMLHSHIIMQQQMDQLIKIYEEEEKLKKLRKYPLWRALNPERSEDG